MLSTVYIYRYTCSALENCVKIPKRKPEIVNQRKTENITAKRKRTKGQNMIYKTLHLKLMIEQHETYINRG